MKHNNALPNNHFKKTALRYRTWFDQPARHMKRRVTRAMKSARIYPHPLKKLRPIVQCPTVRYNINRRLGRGFTLRECAEAGIDPHHARLLGISVDARRKNKSVEALRENVERLKLYLSRVRVYSNRSEAICSGAKQHTGVIMPIVRRLPPVKTMKLSEFNETRPTATLGDAESRRES